MLDGHEPHACVRDFPAQVGVGFALRANADVVFGVDPLVGSLASVAETAVRSRWLKTVVGSRPYHRR